MLYTPFIKRSFEKVFITDKETEDSFYSVCANGEKCEVLPCRVSAMPFNMFWPGHQREKEQTEIAYFINIFGDEEVELSVTCQEELKNPVVRPLAKKIDLDKSKNTVKFTLQENGQYVFENGDSHFALHIFYSPKKDHLEEATYYFGSGIHQPLLINLKSNESLFIHPEAIVYATVFAKDAENIRIYGGGILDDSCQERVTNRCVSDFPIGNIKLLNCKNVIIEDVILLDSAAFSLSIGKSENVTVDNVKIVGQWRYNTDGIDLLNSSNVEIKNSFMRTFDDCTCVKTLYNHDVSENISVKNCVLWCDWGKTLELGLETSANIYRNISYNDCYLIHNTDGAIAISNGCYADISGVTYNNIHVEFQSYNRKQIIHSKDDEKYVDDGITDVAFLISIYNWKFRDGYSSVIADERDNKYGYTHDISFNNIFVYSDMEETDLKLRLWSFSEESPVENIRINNVFLNGKKIESMDEFIIKSQFAKNIQFS